MVESGPVKWSAITAHMEKEKKQGPDWRLWALRFTIAVAFAVLLAQLWRLQIVEGHSFRQLADINRFRVSPVAAPRGVIYDRNHKIVAANTPSFQVAIVPAALPKDNPGRVYSELGNMLNIDPAEIADKVTRRHGDDFTPVTIKSDVERDVVLRVEERHLRLPGVIVQPESSRLYPYGTLLSHILGYMLPITEEQLAANQSDKQSGYVAEDRVGATGLESSYEKDLRGTPGKKLYEVDATERPVADLRIDNPDPGHNLALSIDVDLQKDVARILSDGMGKSLSAAAIVMDPRNGQVLAMVSIPSYDNNLFSSKVKDSDLQALLNDPGKPMIDYAMGGTFAPGSTYKLVTAAASLQEGVANANTRILCQGALIIPNQYNPALSQRLPCWGVHGLQDFVTGLANSCDVYYWTLGGGFKDFKGVGNERLAKWGNLMGYGAPTGIDIPGEAKGLVPTADWKKETWSEDWLTGDTYNMSIGQGFVLATPLQVANATNAIANGGHLYKPKLVASIRDSEENLLKNVEPEEVRQIPLSQENLDIIKAGMKIVPTNDDVKNVNIPALKIAGKTGTAEFPGERDAKGILPTHGWFTAFAPYDDPQVSVTVFVQRGGGPSDAAPIAMKIFARYFNYSAPTAAPTPTPQQTGR
ncbi:MAG TPA: penicillin-binding protein 2 [Chloroflexota bacterium]|nr:penicillin-binding protein 2 [Chloroflexota bacterium]